VDGADAQSSKHVQKVAELAIDGEPTSDETRALLVTPAPELAVCEQPRQALGHRTGIAGWYE
jgi:hypothetical protein